MSTDGQLAATIPVANEEKLPKVAYPAELIERYRAQSGKNNGEIEPSVLGAVEAIIKHQALAVAQVIRRDLDAAAASLEQACTIEAGLVGDASGSAGLAFAIAQYVRLEKAGRSLKWWLQHGAPVEVVIK